MNNGSCSGSCSSDGKESCKHSCKYNTYSCSSSHTMLYLVALVALVDHRYRHHSRLPPRGALEGLPTMGVAPTHTERRFLL